MRQTDILFDSDGVECYSPRAAAKYLKVLPQTLWSWEKSCTYLDGAGLETRTLRGFLGRRHTYYTLRCLNRVRDNRARLPLVPKYRGLVYIPDAIEKLQVSRRTFWRLLKKHKAKTVSKDAKNTNGRVSPRWYVRKKFLKAVLTERARKVNPNVLSFAEAAQVLGVQPCSMINFVRSGKLKPVRSGRRKNGRGFSRSAVESLRKERCGEAECAVATPPNGHESKPMNGAIAPVPESAPTAALPRWDEQTAILYWGEVPVRQFRGHPAQNQRELIEAFHRAGWARTVDDPFRNAGKLNQTLRDLNRTLLPQTIHFRGDGMGLGAIWEPANNG